VLGGPKVRINLVFFFLFGESSVRAFSFFLPPPGPGRQTAELNIVSKRSTLNSQGVEVCIYTSLRGFDADADD
jgi:hypothetical protein